MKIERGAMLPLLAALLLLPMTAARAGGPADGVDEPASDEIAEFEAAYEAAREEMRARLNELRETAPYREAYEARDFDKVRALSDAISGPVMTEWRRRAEELARRHPAGEGRIRATTILVRTSLSARPAELFAEVVGAEDADPRIAPLLEAGRRLHRPLGAERFAELMTRVIDANPARDVQAWAHFGRGSARLAVRDDADARERGLEDYDRVAELAEPESMLWYRARGPRFEETRLQNGMKAPDIVGVDLFGEEFRLSDYAGKVVMLDFWGDW